MIKKFALAVLLAPLLFAGMQTSSFAATCSASTTAINCDTFDGTLGVDAVVASFAVDQTLVNSSFVPWYTFLHPLLAADPFYSHYTGEIYAGWGVNLPILIANALPSGVTDFTASLQVGMTYILQLDHGIIQSIDGFVSQTNTFIEYKKGGISGNNNVYNQTPSDSISFAVSVPGPEAGAGIGTLAMGGMAFWMKRRRKDQALAA